jgi:hypothetical protein
MMFERGGFSSDGRGVLSATSGPADVRQTRENVISVFSLFLVKGSSFVNAMNPPVSFKRYDMPTQWHYQSPVAPRYKSQAAALLSLPLLQLLLCNIQRINGRSLLTGKQIGELFKISHK